MKMKCESVAKKENGEEEESEMMAKKKMKAIMKENEMYINNVSNINDIANDIEENIMIIMWNEISIMAYSNQLSILSILVIMILSIVI